MAARVNLQQEVSPKQTPILKDPTSQQESTCLQSGAKSVLVVKGNFHLLKTTCGQISLIRYSLFPERDSSAMFNISSADTQTVKSSDASVHLSEYYYKPPAE